MLSLHKHFIHAQTPLDRTSVYQQIEVTDQQIDKLVYELYGLSDEEIEIVEEQISVSVATESTPEGTSPTAEQFIVS
jgi:hypothetical protein